MKTEFLKTCLMVPLLVLFSASARGEYSDDWGPAAGSPLPMLEALDQDGVLRQLDDLSGSQGLLLFLNRSADW